MGIFFKRPLCLFCFSFIVASITACFFDGRYNLYLFLLCVAALIVCIVLSFKIKKRKYGLIEASIALFMALLAFLSSYIFIDMSDERAKELCGEEITVEFVVLEEDFVSRYSSSYEGKLISVNGEKVSIPAKLSCEYEGDYAVGDTVFTFADVSYMESHADKILDLPSDVILCIEPMVEREQAIVYKGEGRIDVLFAGLREGVKERFIKLFNFDSAALATGLVTGNKSGISTELIRDFRRSGLSHVLAVSGLHLAIVLGAFELLFRKLYVKKGIRCIILSILAFLLLTLSGFSASACRSVIMLLCTYFLYVLSRESDALTSLGVAGALIILISPRSIGDIGFWLSFLATFGLVTWLSLMNVIKARAAKKKGRFVRFLGSLWGKIFAVVTTSICATLSVSIVSWLIFGEISVIGPLANLIVTPLCEVYLIFSLVAFIFGGLPVACVAFRAAAGFINGLISSLVSFFSSQSFAVVSLGYAFAGIIISVASVAMLVLLIVKLKHKHIVLGVPAVAIVSFFVCLVVFNAAHDGTRSSYINEKGRDSLVFVKSSAAVIFDISDGTYSSFYNSILKSEEYYATEVSAVVLTHYHVKYISSLNNIFRNEMVREVYLPLPGNDDERAIAHDIARTAEKHGVLLVTYAYGEGVYISDSMGFCVLKPSSRSGSEKKIINLCVATDGSVITYADRSWELCEAADRVEAFIGASDVTLLGSHGPERPKDTPMSEYLSFSSAVVASAGDSDGLVFDFYIPSGR